METTTSPQVRKKIGLATTVSIVVGNMVGSGIFLLPATLGMYGGISLLGWVGSSIGAMFLALLFSRLSRIVPNATGGPYAFSREGLGPFSGFLIAWGYWISIWCTNAAIVIGFVSYLTVFVPILSTSPVAAVLTGLATVWLLTWINTLGIKEAGYVQLVTTILKLTPLLLVSVYGIFFFNPDHFLPFNTSGESNFSALTITATLTLFAYQGMECATIPADNIEDPEKTIPRATIIGTLIAMFIYILGSAAVMGLIAPAVLQNSNAPFADAAALLWGEKARSFVAFGAIISTFGALNGWIIIQGQIPMAAARDKIFPKLFAIENKRGVPAIGIVISSALISALMVMNYTKGLGDIYKFMLLLATFSVLVPYLFSAASYGMIILRNTDWKKHATSAMIIAAGAFIYSMWAIIGVGEESVYWGVILLFSGIPFYVWMKRKS